MNKHLRRHIFSLIENYINEETGYFSVDMLDEHEKNLLVSYICEYEDGCEFYLAVCENFDYETIEAALHGLMRAPDKETTDIFANVMKTKIAKHYENKMISLCDEVLNDYLLDRQEYYRIESEYSRKELNYA